MTDTEKLRSLREIVKDKELEKVFGHKRWATEEEADILYDLTKANGIGRVVEVGTANGWTASWFALAGAEVFTFDLIDRPKIYLADIFPLKELASRIHFQAIPSPECFNHIQTSDVKTLWFIDALHKYEPVKADLEAVLKVCRSGDYIVQHDVTGEAGSAAVWEETQKMNVGVCQMFSTRNGIGVTRVH